MRRRKCFRNVNISNGLFFFERCSLITATACANKFSKRANARYSILIHTPSQLYEYIFRKRTIHCLIVWTVAGDPRSYSSVHIILMLNNKADVGIEKQHRFWFVHANLNEASKKRFTSTSDAVYTVVSVERTCGLAEIH